LIGEIVKRQSGASESELISNCKWLKTTYNVQTPMIITKLAPKADKGFSSYTEKRKPVYFDNNLRWDFCVEELARILKSNVDSNHNEQILVCFNEPRSFKGLDTNKKVECMKYLLNKIPASNHQALADIFEFLSIGALEKDFSDSLGCSKDLLVRSLELFIPPKNTTQIENADTICATIFKYIANATRHKKGQELIISEINLIVKVVINVLVSEKNKNNLITKAITTALVNILFLGKEALGFSNDLKSDLVISLTHLIQSTMDDTVVNAYYGMIKLINNQSEVKSMCREKEPMLAKKVETIGSRWNRDVYSLAGDFKTLYESD
jgi:PUL domain